MSPWMCVFAARTCLIVKGLQVLATLDVALKL